MKKSNRKTPLYSGIIILTLGIVIIAIGIAILVLSIKDSISYDNSEIVAQIIVSLVVLGLGIILIVLGSKPIYLRIRKSKTRRRGKETTAKITDYRTVSVAPGRSARIRYAFVLFYNDGVSDKTFTTDFIYDINEYNYLIKLEKVRIKFDETFATICEPFPKDIYKVDSDYGIDLKFYKQKPIKILFCLWAIFFVAALIFLITSIIMGNDTAILAAIIVTFGIHGPFMIALTVYLIKWYKRK